MLIQITDPFLLPDGTNWTGTIIYTLLYATTLDGATVVGAQQALQITNGISIQLAPGLYNVQLNQSGLRDVITAQWGVPVSGGPYTVAEISSNVSLQGSFGGVVLSGTPTTGQVPTATSPTAATWQSPAGGSGNLLTRVVTINRAAVLALNSVAVTLIPATAGAVNLLQFVMVQQDNAFYQTDSQQLRFAFGAIGSPVSENSAGMLFAQGSAVYLDDARFGSPLTNDTATNFVNQPYIAYTTDAVTESGGTGGDVTFTVFYLQVAVE